MNNFQIITLKKVGINDFAEERNLLLRNAKKEWVFFLDSDESMSKRLKSEIKMLNPEDCEGYYVERKNYFLGEYIGSDKILRLGKRNSGKWERKVHERWQINGKVGVLKYPIIHNSVKSISEMVSKVNLYSTLHAEANKREGKKTNLCKIIFFPKLKFIQSLIMGRGVVFSILQAFHSFLSWTKLYFLDS